MNHFSDIGFAFETEEDFQSMVEEACEHGDEVESSNGFYLHYTDRSGAALWVLIQGGDTIMSVEPHFTGKSRRTVCLNATIQRDEEGIEGAYHAWAEPAEENKPDSGIYPFVFDVPGFNATETIEMPRNVEIQLAAFAQQLFYYDSVEEFEQNQEGEPKFAVQSFIPSGLFFAEGEGSDTPEAQAMFAGIVLECERRTNQLVGSDFYWLLVDTLGGEVDLVADPLFFDSEPKVNGVVKGSFWLSGRLIDPVHTG